jgi:hypothetical protein
MVRLLGFINLVIQLPGDREGAIDLKTTHNKPGGNALEWNVQQTMYYTTGFDKLWLWHFRSNELLEIPRNPWLTGEMEEGAEVRHDAIEADLLIPRFDEECAFCDVRKHYRSQKEMKEMKFEVYTWEAGEASKLRGHAELTDEGFFSDVPQAGLWLTANALPVIASVSLKNYLESRMNRDDAAYHLKAVPGPDLDALRVVGYTKNQSRLYAFDGEYWHALADVEGLPDARDLPDGSNQHVPTQYLAAPVAFPEPVQDWQLFTGDIHKHLPRDFVAVVDPLPLPYDRATLRADRRRTGREEMNSTYVVTDNRSNGEIGRFTVDGTVIRTHNENFPPGLKGHLENLLQSGGLSRLERYIRGSAPFQAGMKITVVV